MRGLAVEVATGGASSRGRPGRRCRSGAKRAPSHSCSTGAPHHPTNGSPSAVPQTRSPSMTTSRSPDAHRHPHHLGVLTSTFVRSHKSEVIGDFERARGGVRTRTSLRTGGFKTSRSRPAGLVESVWPAHVRRPCPSSPSRPLSFVRYRRVPCRNRAASETDCPTACTTIRVMAARQKRSISLPSELADAIDRAAQPKARPSAPGSPTPPPTASASTPAAAASPSGNANTAPSPLTNSPKDSPGPGDPAPPASHARARE